jgi:hypothetical protein
MTPFYCVQFYRLRGQLNLFSANDADKNFTSPTYAPGVDGMLAWCHDTYARNAKEWRVHIGTLAFADGVGVQLTLTCTKPYRSRISGKGDRPGRRRFVGTFEECVEYIEPLMRML